MQEQHRPPRVPLAFSRPQVGRNVEAQRDATAEPGFAACCVAALGQLRAESQQPGSNAPGTFTRFCWPLIQQKAANGI